jgi:hypothetical protein
VPDAPASASSGISSMAGIKDEIVLIDRRREYVDDRTWCYWSVEPTAFWTIWPTTPGIRGR